MVGVQVVPTDDHYVDDRDDDQQDRGPQRGLMIPSSMGLRFQIPQDLDTFIVTASWGTYASVATEEVTAAGRKIRHFRRTPMDVAVPIEVADLKAGHTTTVILHERVCLRIDLYDDEHLVADSSRSRSATTESPRQQSQ